MNWQNAETGSRCNAVLSGNTPEPESGSVSPIPTGLMASIVLRPAGVRFGRQHQRRAYPCRVCRKASLAQLAPSLVFIIGLKPKAKNEFSWIAEVTQ